METNFVFGKLCHGVLEEDMQLLQFPSLTYDAIFNFISRVKLIRSLQI